MSIRAFEPPIHVATRRRVRWREWCAYMSCQCAHAGSTVPRWQWQRRRRPQRGWQL